MRLALPPASASCLVPGVRTSAPNRVVRHELKTTAQCGAALPTAPRAYTAAARAAQRRQGSAKKRKDPGLISGKQHRPPDYVEQSPASCLVPGVRASCLLPLPPASASCLIIYFFSDALVLIQISASRRTTPTRGGKKGIHQKFCIFLV